MGGTQTQKVSTRLFGAALLALLAAVNAFRSDDRRHRAQFSIRSSCVSGGAHLGQGSGLRTQVSKPRFPLAISVEPPRF